MTKGTRNIFGEEAKLFRSVTDKLREVAVANEFQEFIPSSLCSQEIFTDKAGPEILGQMYTFNDKGDRPICLIPEVTAVCQRLYKDNWVQSLKKPVKLFYLSRCYRYERPQAGRYREFWQFGVEMMGPNIEAKPVIDLMTEMLKATGLPETEFTVEESVKRGLSYYIEDGFEASVSKLGAQKQIAGGGRYDVGIGFAIGVDRLMLALP